MTSDLDPRFRFENFVVGSANRLAVAAARAVGQSPGTAYNPLYVYSGSGLGKTHLMLAIGHLARRVQPGLKVLYVTVDEFVNQWHSAIASADVASFRQRFKVDVLLLDDIQFLAAMPETQSEVLRLFNTIQGGGRQIVVAADRAPGEIGDLDQRLISRLSGGLIVDVGAPDYETRVAILRKKCDERTVHFPPGVVEEVARIPFANVRELQGALNRLIALQILGDASITPQTVRTLLATDRRDVTPEDAPAEVVTAPSDGHAVPRANGGEFASFLSDLAFAVAKHLEEWHLKLREAADAWSARGYRATMLERAIEGREAPDVEALLRQYEAAVARLEALAAAAASIDPAAAESEVFRDPERLDEAEQVVERLLSAAHPLRAPQQGLERSTFEVGMSNQLAVHAADAVVEDPGRRYNPLFIHGPRGVGKTHLINAIGNGLLASNGGELVVAYVNARDFADEVTAALQDGSIERLRARYRSADALILDDVEFATGSQRAQDELFHVFNGLHARGKQIVVASELAPKMLPHLEERLRSRFEGGLVVEVKEPDRLVRERLYTRALGRAKIPLDHALIAYLAERPAASVRDVDATVHRLAKAAQLARVPLSADFARHELEVSVTMPAVMQAAVGVDSAVDKFFLDGEKIVWDWPDVGGRAVEDWR